MGAVHFRWVFLGCVLLLGAAREIPKVPLLNRYAHVVTKNRVGNRVSDQLSAGCSTNGGPPQEMHKTPPDMRIHAVIETPSMCLTWKRNPGVGVFTC